MPSPKVNPKRLLWSAPKETQGGDSIDESTLSYEVGTVADDGETSPLMVVPGQLLEDDSTYEAPISDLKLDDGEHTLALRSFFTERPEFKSTWSNTVTVTITDEVPKPPRAFTAA